MRRGGAIWRRIWAGVAWMPARGFNVFVFDYRGYGASEGTPGLEGAQKDIDAAMRTLLARGDIDKDRIVVYGRSLGDALAVYNVAHSPFRRTASGGTTLQRD